MSNQRLANSHGRSFCNGGDRVWETVCGDAILFAFQYLLGKNGLMLSSPGPIIENSGQKVCS